MVVVEPHNLDKIDSNKSKRFDVPSYINKDVRRTCFVWVLSVIFAYIRSKTIWNMDWYIVPRDGELFSFSGKLYIW